jgi:hypothetical protein
VISGWQTNENQARRFFFTTERASYGAWLGKTEDLGIISAAFFREKVRPIERPVAAPRQSSSEVKDQAGSADSERKQSRQENSAAAASESADYAATGIGRRMQHEVEWVHMELENDPFALVSLRYEFRPALVRLGVFPPKGVPDALIRRGNAKGFADSAYCPEP